MDFFSPSYSARHLVLEVRSNVFQSSLFLSSKLLKNEEVSFAASDFLAFRRCLVFGGEKDQKVQDTAEAVQWRIL